MLAPSLPSPTIETRGVIARVYVLVGCDRRASVIACQGLTDGARSAKMIRSMRAACPILSVPFDR